MRPNCFSNSFRVSLSTQGRPWGQKGGTSPERIFSASAISSCGEDLSPALMAARQEMECSTQVDGGGLQQQLAGHVAVVRGQLFVQLTLMGGVLIDQTQLVSPLCQNIGAENLAHIPQRLFPLRYIKAQLFRLLGLHWLLRLIGHRCSFDLRGGRHGVPCCHVIQQRVGCGVRFRVHVQLRLTGCCPEWPRRGLDFGCIRFFRAVKGDHRVQNILCGGRLPPRGHGSLGCRGSLL